MTRQAADERKGIQRLQAILVVLLLLILSAVAARMVLVDEPQKWRETEQGIAVSRFIDSLWLARTEWIRRGKPAEVTLLNENQKQSVKVMMNKQGWPSVNQGCLRLWQQLGGEIPANELQAVAEEDECHYKINQRSWFVYKSLQGKIVQE